MKETTLRERGFSRFPPYPLSWEESRSGTYDKCKEIRSMKTQETRTTDPASGVFAVRKVTPASLVRLAEMVFEETQDNVARWSLMDIIKSLHAENVLVASKHCDFLLAHLDTRPHAMTPHIRILVASVQRAA